jgi:O-antigen/teichoic acid export membrane protein
MRLGRGALGVFGANALNVVLSFGTSIFLARTLGVQGRGEFAIFSASFGILSLLFGFGLDVALRYYVAMDRVPRERILTSLIVFVLAVGTVLGVIVHLNDRRFSNELFLPNSKQTVTFELVLVGVVMANVFYSNIASVFAGARSFNLLNRTTMGFAVVSLAGYGALYSAKEAGAAIGTGEVFLAYLVLTLFYSAVLGVLAWWILGVRPTLKLLDRSLLTQMIRYAGLAFAANIAQFLNYRIDIWIVQYFWGSISLGLYSLAGNLAMMLWILPRSAAAVLLPAVAAGDAGTSFEQVARLGRLILAVSAVVGVAAAFLANLWIGLLYGQDFVGAAGAFAVLAIGCVPFSLCVVQAGALAGLNRQEINLAASGVGLIVTVVLDVCLIPRFGISGAAAASAASYIVTTAVVARAFSRIGSVPLTAALFPQRGDLRYVRDGLKNLLR